MTARRCFALAVCMLAVSAQSVRADVVYGNLGSDGNGALSDLGADFGPSAAVFKILAQGFTTGSSVDFLTLQTVSIGAFAESASARGLAIYTNAVGDVPGTFVAGSSAVIVQAKDTYTFNFGGVELDPSTSYWVVPQFNADWFWYQNEELVPPVGQNGSGYTFLGAKRSNNDLSGVWANTSSAFSVSISAVPEPSSVIMGIAGATGLVAFRLRRRMTQAG